MTRRFTRRAFAGDLAALVGSLGLFCLAVKAYPQQPASPRRIGVERVQGIGTSQGVTVDTLKNGDKIFWNFQSKSKKIEKEGGSWELTFEGAGEIVGGTGKYKNAKGTRPFLAQLRRTHR